MHGYTLAVEACPHSPVEVARVSAASRASSEGPSRQPVTAAPLPAGDAGEEEARQQVSGQQQAQPQAQPARPGSRAPSPALPSLPSLGAAAAASALMVAGGPACGDPAALTTALTAGMRAAELTRAGSGASSEPGSQQPASRAPTPQPQPGALAGRAGTSRPPLPRSQRPSADGRSSGETHRPAATAGTAQPLPAFADSHDGAADSEQAEHVMVELGELHLSSTSEGEGWGGGWGGDEPHARPLVKPGSRSSAA